MKLFPGIKRGASWHLTRSVVLFLLVFVAIAYYRNSESAISEQHASKTILSTSNIVLNDGQVAMLSTGMRKLLSAKSAIVQEEPVGEDTDEDGNSKICHRAPQYRGDQCEFVQRHCPQPLGGSYINYMTARYCWFAKVPPIFFILAFLLVLLLFYMLSDTAEANFCPSLTEISRYLRLSPNVAGVTFLALGNGAPDIASIIAGVLSGSTGFGVGEPIGAGLFVTTAVMAAVTLLSEVTVDGAPFLRDSITYLISITFVFGLYLSGKIVLWQSLICLLIYFGYVATVIIGRFVFLYVIKPRREKKEKVEHDVDNEEEDDQVAWYGNEEQKNDAFYSGATYFPKLGLVYANRRHKVTPHVSIQEVTTPAYDGVIAEHFTPQSEDGNEEITEEEEEEFEYNYHGFWGGVRRRRDTFLNWIEWNDKSIFQKVFYLFEWPTILARNLTIPKADPDDWSKFFAVITPPFIGPFVLFALHRLDMTVGQSPMPLWSLLAIIGLVPSVFILFTTNRRTPPRYHFIFVFAAFVLSILWIMIVANELVGLLQSIGVMWRVSDGILAMTVLAWGNSLGDLVSDVVISRQGFPSMAVGAVYSGPCLNLLIGLGLSITAHCITKSPAFIIEATPTVTMSFIFLLASMVSALVIIAACRFRAPKAFGVMLLAIYIIFMVLSMLMEFELIFAAV